MKINIAKVWLSVVAAGVFQANADVSLPGAVYSTDAWISPSGAGTDFWVYEETTPGMLTLTNLPGSLTGVLHGHAGAPGGNIELFAGSEGSIYADSSAGGAFASVAPVVLAGSAGSIDFTFRSLNGQDWFGSETGYHTNYGAPTLATRWFDGFIDAVTGLMTNPFAAAGVSMVRESLFNEWRDAGGFASLSDPNIGYVYQDAEGALNFGLEGFIDASPRFRELLDQAGYGGFLELIPDGIQYSEVVMVDEVPYYSFNNGTPSGVQLDDAPYHSYTANFAFSAQVPEPSGVLLAGFVLPLACLRRRR